MIPALTLLLLFQLAGEVLARAFGLVVPGPVVGLVLLFLALNGLPGLRRVVTPTASGLLRLLSVLFVPAAVGIVQQLPLLRTQAFAIGIAVLLSTWLTIAVTALTFRAIARAVGAEDAS